MPDDSFLANVEREGDLNVRPDEEEKDTTTVPPPEKNQEDKPDSLSEEKKGESSEPEKGEKPEVFQAFHKHPRWLQAQEELKELREFRDRVEPLLSKIGETNKGEETIKIPAWFKTLFGEHQEAWDQYREYSQSERQALRREVLKELHEEQQKVSDADKKANEQIDKELQAIVEDEEFGARAKAIGFDLKNKDQLTNFRNELLKAALDYEITNLSKAFDILEYRKSKKEQKAPDRRKELADKTMQKGKSEGQKKNYMTSHDLRDRSFTDLVPDEE